MYIPNIGGPIKRMTVNEVMTLSLKTIINKLDFLKKTSYYSVKHLKKRFAITCKN